MNRTIKISILIIQLLISTVILAGAQANSQVVRLIKSVVPGQPVIAKNLTLVPLYSDLEQPFLDLVTFEQAMRAGRLSIEELDGGTVPQVVFYSTAGKPVFILGGEIITGCKQDRIIGHDVLISPGRQNLRVPVFCVESGRWTAETGVFYSQKNMGTSYLRREAQNDNMSSQGKIWSKIDEMNSKLGIDSHTSAYQDAYETVDIRHQLAQYEHHIKRGWPVSPQVVGVLVAVDGEVISLDLFASHALLSGFWEKLSKAAIYTALQTANVEPDTAVDVGAFLAAVAEKEYITQQGVDLGFEVSAVDAELSVSGLIYHDRLIHLAAFPNDTAAAEPYYYEQQLQENDIFQYNNYHDNGHANLNQEFFQYQGR